MSDVVGAATSLFNYFSPTRSPYYTIVLAACAGMFWACDITNRALWLTILIPVFAVAALSLYLSIDSANTLSKQEHEEQLRFSRSTCISVAVVALAFAGRAIALNDGGENQILNFKLNVIICCIQISIFLVYNWALNRTGLPTTDHNYVQITLLTSAFLGDTSWNLAQATEKSEAGSAHHQWTAYLVGLLWVICAVFWIAQLVRLKVVQIRIDRVAAAAPAPTIPSGATP